MGKILDSFTTGEVSKILGIAEKTVRNYCDRGKLGCRQTPVTRHRRISREALVGFMEEYCVPLSLLERFEEHKRVLIVEDNEDELEGMEFLVSYNYKNAVIETASDGHEACIKAGILVPDIVVLDLNLPGRDGVEVCRTIRSVEKTRHARIVVVSGYLENGFKKRLEQYDIAARFRKPVRADSFLKTFDTLYRGGRS